MIFVGILIHIVYLIYHDGMGGGGGVGITAWQPPRGVAGCNKYKFKIFAVVLLFLYIDFESLLNICKVVEENQEQLTSHKIVMII